jgi:hypothetical protein
VRHEALSFTDGGERPAIDPNRFVLTTTSFPYEPPPHATDTVPTKTSVFTNATTSTTTQQVQTEYGVSVTVSAGIQFLTTTLKTAGSLQWTNTSTSTQTTGSTQQASVTVGGPAFGYTGLTDILVYWDTIYQSFMFAFSTGSPSASGMLTDSAAKARRSRRSTCTDTTEPCHRWPRLHWLHRWLGPRTGPRPPQRALTSTTERHHTPREIRPIGARAIELTRPSVPT